MNGGASRSSSGWAGSDSLLECRAYGARILWEMYPSPSGLGRTFWQSAPRAMTAVAEQTLWLSP